jgi:hypothetical protein
VLFLADPLPALLPLALPSPAPFPLWKRTLRN